MCNRPTFCCNDSQGLLQKLRIVWNFSNNCHNMDYSSGVGAGIKLVLPALLKGVEDRQWRTKQGSIQLLGAMAYCAPRQLGTCLPTVVPRLSTVLSDPHPRVQAAARTALHEVRPCSRSVIHA